MELRKNRKARILAGPKQQEMAVESEGRQPVVAMKPSNAGGAKGHS